MSLMAEGKELGFNLLLRKLASLRAATWQHRVPSYLPTCHANAALEAVEVSQESIRAEKLALKSCPTAESRPRGSQ